MKNIPFVLDTDTPLKTKKYIKCGMKMCGKKSFKSGFSLYCFIVTDRTDQLNKGWNFSSNLLVFEI